MNTQLEKMGKIIERNEDLMHELCSLFLSNAHNPSLQQIFRKWLRELVERNKGANRNVNMLY